MNMLSFFRVVDAMKVGFSYIGNGEMEKCMYEKIFPKQ